MHLSDLLAHGTTVARTPWLRVVVDEETWTNAAQLLATGQLTLISLWGDDNQIHLALLDEPAQSMGILTLECASGHFPSIAAHHVPAQRLERTICDLFGYVADGAVDNRAWLDHGRWRLRHPLGQVAPIGDVAPYAFLPAEGEALHEIPVGPVHAGIIEPGHFRFTASGETIVRLEERLGYVHKGIESLMRNVPLEKCARLAARTSGDSTVAYSLAFAHAIETALGVEVPPRAQWLRAIMLELERIANHFGDIGAICNDASFVIMHAHCGVMRERVLRLAEALFGHRLMMDRGEPGGVTVDLDETGARKLKAFVRYTRRRLPALLRLYDETASLQDRTVGTGQVDLELVRQFGAGGFIGRASGRNFDIRRNFPFAPYDGMKFVVPVLAEGDVDARVRLRFQEIGQGLGLLDALAGAIPEGPIRSAVPMGAGEGIGFVEGFRGDIFVWVRLNGDGTIARCHLRDPSWFQWPLLEAAIDGNIVADFPLVNKSFNCSYAGHDL